MELIVGDNDGFQLKSRKLRRCVSPTKDSESITLNVNVSHGKDSEKRVSDKTTRTMYVKGTGFNLPKALGLNDAREFKTAVQSLVGATETIDAGTASESYAKM